LEAFRNEADRNKLVCRTYFVGCWPTGYFGNNFVEVVVGVDNFSVVVADSGNFSAVADTVEGHQIFGNFVVGPVRVIVAFVVVDNNYFRSHIVVVDVVVAHAFVVEQVALVALVVVVFVDLVAAGDNHCFE